MQICISSAHSKHVRGAAGSPIPPQLDEVDASRHVVESVAAMLRTNGADVRTFHDDISKTQDANLQRIVEWHNDHVRDLDISIHFNATKDHKGHGTEVWYVTQDVLAGKISAAIAAASGLTDRGGKYTEKLYFLNNSEMPAVLIEVCFCDNTDDCQAYRASYGLICESIAGAVYPAGVSDDITPDWSLFPDNQRDIICTVFGGAADYNVSAYDEHYIDDDELGCALPYKWKTATRPQVFVVNVANNKSVTCAIVDVGPWNIDDPYWRGDERPQAESGTDMKGRTTNGAGIDLTPGAARAIGLEGKGVVHWRFDGEFDTPVA